jgi:hypothetical protein
MSSLEASLKELIDRQKIWDCLLRYARGVDRLDRELMLSAFAENALIDQGSFKGSRDALADWVLVYHAQNQTLTQHMMTNHYCEINGDVAHTETCVAYYGTNPQGKDAFAVGRYIDRLVCEANDWLIVDRVCTTEGAANLDKNDLLAALKPVFGSIAVPTRNRADPSYRRPLVIPRL